MGVVKTLYLLIYTCSGFLNREIYPTLWEMRSWAIPFSAHANANRIWRLRRIKGSPLFTGRSGLSAEMLAYWAILRQLYVMFLLHLSYTSQNFASQWDV